MPKKKTVSPRGKAKLALHLSLIGALHQELGEEFATSLGHSDHKIELSGVISTRCPSVDQAIGRGGVPLRRLTIIHGPQGGGKTTLALQLVAEVQAMGGAAVYFDKEYKLDPDYARALGVNIKRLVISQPDSLEQVIQGVKAVIKHAASIRERTGKRRPILIVLDSLNACQALASIKAEEGSKLYPEEARIWSKELPQLVKMAKREDVALVFISQIRKKLNIMYGDDEGIAGGNAPPFYASLILSVRNMGAEKEGVSGQKVANKIQVECKKNQIAPPFRKGKFILRYGTGADYEDSLLTACEMARIVRRKGGRYVVRDNKKLLGVSREKTIRAMRKDPEMLKDLQKRFRKQWETEENAIAA